MMFLYIEGDKFYHLLALLHDTILMEDCVRWADVFVCGIGC